MTWPAPPAPVYVDGPAWTLRGLPLHSRGATVPDALSREELVARWAAYADALAYHEARS